MEEKKLTPTEIKSIQRTFEMVAPLADTFALIFYDRFYHLEPAGQELFHIDMALQREKLMQMLAFIVRGLDKPDSFVGELREMGLRHASYRVEPGHYPILIEAIIYSLEECLGGKVTDEMKAAWRKALTIISEIMMVGANDPKKPDTVTAD
jgi:nitric oxide dioxygenase